VAVKCTKCNSDNTDTAKFCSECATPLQPFKNIGITRTIETPVEEFTRGTLFADRYEIIEVLGKGGMGNVHRVEDTRTKEEIAFITMEYVSGEDLKSLIRRVGRLDSGTTIKIANQVCEGLSEAHRLGVVHRDLKPSNIMIDKEGNARIMDFGIARSLRAKGLTGEGIIISSSSAN